jgi:DNA-binding NarL/FixJ family response regulator
MAEMWPRIARIKPPGSGYSVLLIAAGFDDRARLTLAFMTAAPNVRLCVLENAAEARGYLLGEGSYADRDMHPEPQVVLLDLELPSRSAFRFLEWMRREADFCDIPVLVLACPDDSGDVDLAYALGANSCLVKAAGEEAILEVAKGIGDYAALLAGTASGRHTRLNQAVVA